VAKNLYALMVAEQSYYSEFGRYLAAGAYPPEPPRAAYTVWRQGEAGGFDELGWAPNPPRSTCSYAVSVSQEGCEMKGGCGFTAEAAAIGAGTGRSNIGD